MIAFYYESPLFIRGGKETYVYLIGVLSEGVEFTHKFAEFDCSKKAKRYVEKISNANSINKSLWVVGNAWDEYKTIETYDEEKASHIEACIIEGIYP